MVQGGTTPEMRVCQFSSPQPSSNALCDEKRDFSLDFFFCLVGIC
jgi:hypothetical protein